MDKVHISIAILSLLSLMFVTFTHSASLPEAARVRRSSADQRVAELQALLALSQGKARSSYRIAHGQFDPETIGKRKRSDFGSSQQVSSSGNSGMSEDERYNVLRALIAKAALDHSA